jgi:hypothetical protein
LYAAQARVSAAALYCGPLRMGLPRGSRPLLSQTSRRMVLLLVAGSRRGLKNVTVRSTACQPPRVAVRGAVAARVREQGVNHPPPAPGELALANAAAVAAVVLSGGT